MNQKQISLFLIIFQSCGIRFFEGQGFLLSIILLFLNIKAIRNIEKKEYLILIIGISFFLFYYFLNTSFGIKGVIFLITQFIAALFVLVRYKQSPDSDLVDDLIKVLKIYVIHAGISFILYFILPFLYVRINFSGYKYMSLLGIFYIAEGYGLLGLGVRSTGLAWEPGLIQLYANLYAILLIIKKRMDIRTLILIGLFILSTNSTSGFLGFAVVLSGYLFSQQKATVTRLLVITLMAVLTPIALSNIENKMGGETQTSGQARMRDATIGALLIKEKPLKGHGFFDRDYLFSYEQVTLIDIFFMNETFIDENGELAGGYTNGLLCILIQHGIPIGLLIFLALYHNNLTNNRIQRIHLFGIFVICFFSEPITNTSLFYLIILSAFYKNKLKAVDDNEQPNESHIYYNCNI